MLKRIKWLIVILFIIIMALYSFRFFILPEYIFPKKFSDYVEKYSAEYNVDENLVYAVIHSESGFEIDALSHKEAKGLMQITESTGAWAAEKIGIEDFEISKLYDPDTNIRIGCWYLAELLKQFDGSVSTAIAAYNAGNGKVSEWLSNEKYSSDGITLDTIPYEETLNYVKRVTLIHKIYEYLYK